MQLVPSSKVIPLLPALVLACTSLLILSEWAHWHFTSTLRYSFNGRFWTVPLATISLTPEAAQYLRETAQTQPPSGNNDHVDGPVYDKTTISHFETCAYYRGQLTNAPPTCIGLPVSSSQDNGDNCSWPAFNFKALVGAPLGLSHSDTSAAVAARMDRFERSANTDLQTTATASVVEVAGLALALGLAYANSGRRVQRADANVYEKLEAGNHNAHSRSSRAVRNSLVKRVLSALEMFALCVAAMCAHAISTITTRLLGRIERYILIFYWEVPGLVLLEPNGHRALIRTASLVLLWTTVIFRIAKWYLLEAWRQDGTGSIYKFAENIVSTVTPFLLFVVDSIFFTRQRRSYLPTGQQQRDIPAFATARNSNEPNRIIVMILALFLAAVYIACTCLALGDLSFYLVSSLPDFSYDLY